MSMVSEERSRYSNLLLVHLIGEAGSLPKVVCGSRLRSSNSLA